MITDNEKETIYSALSAKWGLELAALAAFRFYSYNLMQHCAQQRGTPITGPMAAGDRCFMARLRELDVPVAHLDACVADMLKASDTIDYLQAIPD